MVRRRRTPRAKARPTRRNGEIRQLHRAMAFEPITPSRGPNDPPALKLSFMQTATIPIVISLGQKAAITPSTDAASFTMAFTSAGVIPGVGLTAATLYKLWYTYTRHVDVGSISQIALKKISLWGVSNPALSGVCVGLQISQIPPFSSKSASDVGTTNSRAHVSLSCPYNNWVSATSTSELVIVDVDVGARLSALVSAAGQTALAVGQMVGELHITVACRTTTKA